MAIKLLVFACFVAIASANLGAQPPLGYNIGYGYASPAVPVIPQLYVTYNDSKTDAAGPHHADPIIIAAYDVHKLFLEKYSVNPPYQYSYGYEVYNWKTGLTQSHYVSRYGDVGVGTFIIRDFDGSRTILDYTLDTPNGFYGVIRRDVLVQPVTFGFAGLGAPLAYTSHPPHEEYASRTTILANPGAIENSHPLAQKCYTGHNFFLKYFNLEYPFRYSAGYEIFDSVTGLRRSQYETYHGDMGEGSYAQVEVDGTKSSIDYSISPKGFAVTTPQTFSIKANPIV